MRASNRSFTSTIALLILTTLASAASAQTSLATLRGKVADEQGGVLPGATVTARQIETNTTRSSITESLGQYFLTGLSSGTYEITVELAGFSPGRRSDVVLRVGQAADIDFVLRVGAVIVNDSTDYRLDVMPFGGTKQSGIGREGIRFAMQEMTETRVVCLNL